jgi:MFS family permease
MGIKGLQFFALYFFQVYFPAVNPEAAFRTMGAISLIMTLLASVGAGLLSNRIGRRPLILWAMFVCAVVTLLMGLTNNYVVFLILSGLRVAATGPIIASSPALASDLAPKDEAGQYMAYNNLTTGLSGALAGLIFGFIHSIPSGRNCLCNQSTTKGDWCPYRPGSLINNWIFISLQFDCVALSAAGLVG